MANHPSKNIKSLNRWTATPAPVNIEEVPNWIYRELNRLSDAMFNVDIMRLEQTNVDPGTEQGRRQKPRDGDIRYADGTNWNPNGNGQGIYWFDGTNWQPFGVSVLTRLDEITQRLDSIESTLIALQQP